MFGGESRPSAPDTSSRRPQLRPHPSLASRRAVRRTKPRPPYEPRPPHEAPPTARRSYAGDEVTLRGGTTRVTSASRPTIVFALAALLAAAACHSPTDAAPGEPTSLALYIGEVHITRFSSLALLPGSELQFHILLTDASGHTVNGLRPVLVSRNTQSLTIDTLGVMRVVGRGSSWIVGSLLTPARAMLADSTLVNVVCTVTPLPAIQLTVVDSASGQSAPLHAVNITVRMGALRDSLFVPSFDAGAPPFTVGIGYERAGSYDLTVTASGYRDWGRVGIVVGHDLCHVITVNVRLSYSRNNDQLGGEAGCSCGGRRLERRTARRGAGAGRGRCEKVRVKDRSGWRVFARETSG